ncbi:MAG: chorismate mutase [Gemmatimonadaceae bacterium]|nr:chorismate mutase [Gemmatimonadaceae bacterium]NUS99255.1 chorismate mutase [Gemmatimonadaceae bacterium]
MTPSSRRPRHLHAIRGAITVDRDEGELVLAATRELLAAIAERNGMRPQEIVSAIFTLTPDLASQFPALAARQLGWTEAALLCTQEIPVPGALARVIRVLITVEFDEPRTDVAHVYLRDAVALRPDRATPPLPNA